MTVISRQDGAEHLNGSLVKRPVVDDHRHRGSHEALNALGCRGGTHDDVHPPHQPI
jgi:hypothetical protein